MLRTSDQAEGIRAVAVADGAGRSVGGARLGSTRIIAVTSGKGGVGKTQISANLAVLLAQRGQRVLLLDADLGLASLDLALGIRPRADLLAVVRGERSIADVITPAACGVQLVPACPGRYEMANLGPADRERLLSLLLELAARFDVLVIDTGAGIGASSIAFASLATEVLLVATPDPTSLRDAYAMAKVLYRRCGLTHIRVIANQVEDASNGLSVYERLHGVTERFLEIQLEYLGCIPRDESVQRAVVAGSPCVLGEPDSRAGRALHALAQRLAQSTPPEPSRLC